MKDLFFYLFGFLTIASALLVVMSKSPVYSAASLILSFFGLSALYVLWGSTFLGMIQILIYTGAIVVLFVFVVMLLDLGRSGNAPNWNGGLMFLLSLPLAWIFSVLVLRVTTSAPAISPERALKEDHMRLLSKLLFTEYLWPFEVLSIFLLALIVAIYALTRPSKAA